jgi:hypothetical protein
MAFQKLNTHGVVTLRARTGAGANVDLVVPYDMGDVNATDLAKVLNQVVVSERRGQWVSDSHGARVYPKISLSAMFMGYLDTIQEFLFQQGTYSTNVSVQGAGRPYAIDFILAIEGTAGGDAGDWETTFANCPMMPASFSEAGDGDKWAFSFECRGAVSGSLTLAQRA